MKKLKVLAFDIKQISSILLHEGYGFWGLSLEDDLIINDFISDTYKSSLLNIDIIWIYGYDLQDNKRKSISEFIEFINYNVKTCKTVIFDLQGEGHSTIHYLKYFDSFRERINPKINNYKILWNLNQHISYKDYDIFYAKYYELVYWHKVKNLRNLEYKNEYNRKYFFSFLNGTLYDRPHRYKMLKIILNNQHKFKNALISNLDKNTDLPYMCTVNNDNNENIFSSTESEVRQSYINLISESICYSYNNAFFVTEKSIKPFVLQQIPIFLGPTNIVSYFRNYGFDLFDDLIDHSYDSVQDLDLRVSLIYQELTKLNDFDFFTFFKENDHRLYHNFMTYVNMVNNTDKIETELKQWILKV